MERDQNGNGQETNYTGPDLGRMSLQELLAVEKNCRQNILDAQAELSIVLDYMDLRYPDGDHA